MFLFRRRSSGSGCDLCGSKASAELPCTTILFIPLENCHLCVSLIGCVTLVLFRTRRRDECARLEEGVRRRVRKSRQKEAAGAAGAGLMQIEWSERGV